MFKKSFIKLNFLKSEKAAIVAEASFVMPVVMTVVFVLIYLSLIQIQQSVMHMYAQKMANKIYNISILEGYEKFYQNAYKNAEEKLSLPDVYEPSYQTVKEVNSVCNPYRYLGGIYLDEHLNYNEQLREIIEKSSYFTQAIIDTDIEVKFENLSTYVRVQIIHKFKLPNFISLVGVNPDITIKAESINYANDSAEFIRNTDLTFDLFNHFLKKYHLDEKINIFYKKIKEFSK